MDQSSETRRTSPRSRVAGAAAGLAALVGALAAAPAMAASIQVFETTADQTMLLAQQPAIDFVKPAAADATITVVPSQRLQVWAGVGGAMTDSAATVLAAMPEAGRTGLMKNLFAPGIGAGFSLVRVPIGASDFSAVGDFNEEPSPGHFDFSEDERVIIPQLREARTFAPVLRILAAPWSAPAWMKTTATMNGGHFNTQDFAALAD